MFKRVVWATDGSDTADQARSYAQTLAADGGAPMLVVYCEEWTLPGKGGGSLPIHADEDAVLRKIKGQVAEISNDGVEAKLEITKTKVGGAAHSIAEVAENEHADVIVIGSRGHTALAGLLLGSVAQRLLHIASCPVLTIPAKSP